MMGYSVTEAASVLGVPTERVWELLARGVLVGEPDGETGMRVFLQPRPAPAPVAHADDAGTARSNGPERELSPFRELLTEFRSLTERYGQALLALGEARGEVASLRSRVDLLEARIDLRLPMTPPAATPWPTQSLPVAEPVPAGSADPADEVGREHDEDLHRPRRRRARRATEDFAEALARAEDPTLSDLAGASDPDALAAFRSEADATDSVSADSERTLPREVLPAEPVLVAEEAPAVAEPAAEEPEPVAVEPEPAAALEEPEVVDAWTDPLDALAAPVDVGPEPIDAEPVEGAGEPARVEVEAQPVDVVPERVDGEHESWADEPSVAPEAGDASMGAPETGSDPQSWPEPESAGEDAQGVGEAAVTAQAGFDPEASGSSAEGREPDPVEAEPAEFDADRYTTTIEQPDWYEAESDDDRSTRALEAETFADIAESTATEGAQPDLESEEPEELAGDPEATEPDATEPDAAEPPVDADGWPTPDPSGGGADEMEVAGGGQGQASVQPEPDGEDRADPDPALPGSRELDEALEAFGDLGATWAAGREDEWPPTTASVDRIAPSAERSTDVSPTRPSYAAPISSGPATRAYRRLRRIFPT